MDEYLRSEIERQGESVVIEGRYFADADSIDDLSLLFYKIADGVKSFNLSGWTITGNVKNMSYMFYKCSSLESLKLSFGDTTNVEDMFSMFYGCTNLESLDLTSYDTSNVKDMIGIFDSCPALYKVVDNQIIKKLNTMWQ